ncbi:MAG: hypothetical protein JST16_06105 [Bdellovibrionales bacterium]|nr:hypothetical protein [Bdellovibrionales bacterium]
MFLFPLKASKKVALYLSFFAAQSFAGGISGGGGGTINPSPASATQIIQSIYKSEALLRAWLHRQELTFADNSEVGNKLFKSSPNIYDVLANLTVEAPQLSPCIDPAGNQVDGSADGSLKPNTICISIANLQQKLSEYTYEYETAALILHEASHLLGATEDEAVVIQKAALADLNRHSYEELQERADDLKWKFASIQSRIQIFTYAVYVPDCGKARDFLAEYAQTINAIATEDGRLSFLTNDETDQAYKIASDILEPYSEKLCQGDLLTSESRIAAMKGAAEGVEKISQQVSHLGLPPNAHINLELKY